MASKILRVILIIVLFIVFFELGLFSSYTIVTAEAPNFHGLVDMQISKIHDFYSPQKVNDALIKDPTPVNISNKKDVALKMESLSQVDGVNVDSMNITTFDDTDNKNITVNIESLGYATPNQTSGQIVISQSPSFKVLATGQAKYGENGLRVDENTRLLKSLML